MFRLLFLFFLIRLKSAVAIALRPHRRPSIRLSCVVIPGWPINDVTIIVVSICEARPSILMALPRDAAPRPTVSIRLSNRVSRSGRDSGETEIVEKKQAGWGWLEYVGHGEGQRIAR